MLERIKSLFANIKDFVVFVLVPVSFVAGYIAYLLGKNKDLKNLIGGMEEVGKIEDLNKEIKAKKEELNAQAKKATDAESAYKSIRDEFLGQASDVPGSDQSSGSGSGRKE